MGDFDVKSFAESRGISYASARVALTRLRERHEIIRVGRGKYRPLNLEIRARLEHLGSRNKKLLDLVVALYEEMPRLKMILIFGSQARGDADYLSDIDVLVVSDVGMGMRERKVIQEKLSAKLGKRVEIKVVSENQYKRWLMLEPKMRFWLREGIIFDECGLSREVYPVSKIGLLEALDFVDLQLELSKRGRNAAYLFVALRELITLKHTLNLDYDTAKVKCEMRNLLGEGLYGKLRMVSRGKKLKLSNSERSILRKAVFELHPIVAEDVKKLGENEADFYVRKTILKTVPPS